MRFGVRIYELDPQLHLNGAVYIQYSDHARFACLEAAGVSVAELVADGFGPVNLQTTIRYQHEIRMGDEVDVTCGWRWDTGKTYRVHHRFLRPDGELVAEVDHVSGLLDLRLRKLVADPASHWRHRATRPVLLSLPL